MLLRGPVIGEGHKEDVRCDNKKVMDDYGRAVSLVWQGRSRFAVGEAE